MKCQKEFVVLHGSEYDLYSLRIFLRALFLPPSPEGVSKIQGALGTWGTILFSVLLSAVGTDYW